MSNRPLKFYVSLQGIYSPQEYIEYARYIEKLGFDRIYVYDDLMHYPSIPAITLMIQNTRKIKVGTCLLNGFYRHPAIIASTAAFLQNLSNGRFILGLGRGAFFDFVDLNTEETHTRQGYKETIQLVNHYLKGNKNKFEGEIFSSTDKAFLRVEATNQYITTGTWNKDMANLAGKYGNELQIADVWEANYINELINSFMAGNADNENKPEPVVSIGGISCIGNNDDLCTDVVKQVLSIYLPYLTNILKKCNVPLDNEVLKKIDQYSKAGNHTSAAKLITKDMVDCLTISGNPDKIVDKIKELRRSAPIDAIMFSAPFGVESSLQKNLKFIERNIVRKLR